MSTDLWDSSLRGEKMSSTTGETIFKYQMPVLESFTMQLPEGAEILGVEDQGGLFWMSAMVGTNQPDEERQFVALKTGAPVPDANLKYIISAIRVYPINSTQKYVLDASLAVKRFMNWV